MRYFIGAEGYFANPQLVVAGSAVRVLAVLLAGAVVVITMRAGADGGRRPLASRPAPPSVITRLDRAARAVVPDGL